MAIKYFDDEMKRPMLTFIQAKHLHIIYKMDIESSNMEFEEFCRMLEILYVSKKSEIENSELSLYDFFKNLFKSYRDNSVKIIENGEGFRGEICVPIRLTVKLYCESGSRSKAIDSLIRDIGESKKWILDSVERAISNHEYEIDEENIYFIEEGQ